MQPSLADYSTILAEPPAVHGAGFACFQFVLRLAFVDAIQALPSATGLCFVVESHAYCRTCSVRGWSDRVERWAADAIAVAAYNHAQRSARQTRSL